MNDNEIKAPNIGVAQLSRVSSNGTRLVGSAVEANDFISLTISHGVASSDEFTKEIIRPAESIVQIQMSALQWGELVSSFGVGQGVPVTINRLNNKRVDQVYVTKELDQFYEDRTKNMIKGSLKTIEDAMANANDILENKKTITKSDRAEISSAYSKIHRLLNDSLPFLTKLLVEDTETYISQATSQFKTEMSIMLQQHMQNQKQLDDKNTTNNTKE